MNTFTTSISSLSTPPCVLLIDDDKIQRMLVGRVLDTHGYRAITAADGLSGIDAAIREQPDCILLDVQLPDADGFSICRQLKEDDKTRDIPVIFLTSASDTADVVEGLAAGGNDYIHKPINNDVLLARLSVAMRLRHAELVERRARADAVAAYHELYRTRSDLQLAYNLTGLATLAAGLAHEVNNPLGSVIANIDYIDDVFANTLSTPVATHPPANHDDAGTWQESIDECRQALLEAKMCCHKIRDIVQRMSEVGEVSRTRAVDTFDLALVVRSAIDHFRTQNNVAIEIAAPASMPFHGIQPEIAQAINAILDNACIAVKQAGAQSICASPTISISLRDEGDNIVLTCKDSGPGVSSDDLPMIFTPFFTRKYQWRSMGLGLSIAMAVINRHKGSIRVEPHSDLGGALFIVQLPRRENA